MATGRRLALALALALAAPRTARADGEVWTWFEARIPLVRDARGAGRVGLRFMTDVRFNGRSEGLGLMFLRAGVLVQAAPWLTLGVNGTVLEQRRTNNAFDREEGIELEPTVAGRSGAFAWSDRTRLELRWLSAGERWRVRNCARVAWAPAASPWQVFVWDEVFLDLDDGVSRQNRATVGVGYTLPGRTRVEVGYMLRSRRALPDDDWVQDHVALVYLLHDAWR